MPRSKRTTFRLSAALIESAHDYGIAVVWPGIEPVKRATCLDLNLLRSAAYQPYQECFGYEVYPTLAAKAAYLFVHIASGHIFSNGNKRTAAICLDTFLLINSHYLFLSNDEVHDVAQYVATFGERGEKFADVLAYTTEHVQANIIPLSSFRVRLPNVYRGLHARKRLFRKLDENRLDAPLVQQR